MDIRDELVSELKKYLVGPRKEDEILPQIPNHPIDYYTLGILFPTNAEHDALDTDDFDRGSDDTETRDTRDLVPPQIKQSAMGLRVDLADGVKVVNIEIDYAKYDHTDGGWARCPLSREKKEHDIDLTDGTGGIEILGHDGMPDAKLTWMFDEGGAGSGRHRVLNIFLENRRRWKVYGKGGDDFKSVRIENNTNAIFQPCIKIHSPLGQAFKRYESNVKKSINTSDDQSLDLIFRDTVIFGEGFNCAATWERADSPSWVSTEFIPRYVSPSIGKMSKGSDGRPAGVDLHPLSYAGADDDRMYQKQINESIRPVIDDYKRWIVAERRKLQCLEAEDSCHLAAARDNIRRCEDAHRRMDDGLKFLLEDDNREIRLAFMLANRSMLHQRIHYEYCTSVAKGKPPGSKPDPEKPGKMSWYPFQIAFFVMNVRGIVERTSAERGMVDLLWFPTGGGKTEAYLAIAAFAMIHRRMRGDDNDGSGVAIIMRYTLRLLTLQQFERASTLICALEFLRQTNPQYGLGNSPFLIGLWVGDTLTPNTFQKSDRIIREQKNRRESHLAGSSPMQIIHCPWCGTLMDPFCYAVNNRNQWTVTHCKNRDCFFSSQDKTETRHALPILTVDSDIYRRCPSMIISTVDKFARMPYRPEIASIFGRVDRHCETHGFLTAGASCGAQAKHNDGKRIRPICELDGPDLIIQDELHLITGALGSMVGLYETAVDYLSMRRDGDVVVRPKIIGSTATIRGADNQIRKIFNRDPPHKFPPLGIDRDDSFFWWESEKDAGREYVGVSFSQRSAKYSLARIYASLLQKTKVLATTCGHEEIDPYWTLVGYFNSTRELGGAIRLVEDDVTSNIGFITDSIPEYPKSERRDPGRPHDGLEELTGRITQSGIRDIRENLEKKMGDSGCIDTLLATNMISVGIDIERLGLMVVNGQTKNSSEYIQATGRIGRRPTIPGLVFTLYNPYKPRDLSHYEDFTGHHSMLQKHVEPSTLTPFSVGSIERGIHAVLIAMIRLSIPRLSQMRCAHVFERMDADHAIAFILERYRMVQGVGQDDDGYLYAKKYLESFADNWVKSVRQVDDDDSTEDMWYSNPPRMGEFRKAPDNKNVLMSDFSNHDTDSGKFPKATPESLRNVERTVNLKYKGVQV